MLIKIIPNKCGEPRLFEELQLFKIVQNGKTWGFFLINKKKYTNNLIILTIIYQ